MSDGSVQFYFNNLNFETSAEALAQYVSNAIGAQPIEVNIVTRKGRNEGRSRGFGFVRVAADQVEQVLALNGSTLDDRQIGVVVAKAKEERPAAPKTTESQAQSETQATAPAKKKRKAKKKNNKNKSAATDGATESSSSAGDATSTQSASAAPRRARRAPVERKTYENATQLYVNNLHFDVGQDELCSYFEQACNVAPLEVEIVTSKFGRFRGRSRGFGFVTVPNDSVSSALDLAGKVFHERDLGVVVARERIAESTAAAAAENEVPAAQEEKKTQKQQNGGRRNNRQQRANDGNTNGGNGGNGNQKKRNNRRKKKAVPVTSTATAEGDAAASAAAEANEGEATSASTETSQQ